MVNIKLENREDVGLICRLLEFILLKKGVAPEKVEQTKGIVNKLKTQELDLPSNHAEREQLLKIIADLDNKVDGVKISLGDDWNKVIQNLTGGMRSLNEEIKPLVKQYNFVLKRLEEIEKKLDKVNSYIINEKSEPEPLNEQIETSEERDELYG